MHLPNSLFAVLFMPCTSGNGRRGSSKTEKKPKSVAPKIVGPEDEYGRGVPRSSFKGLISAADEKDFAIIEIVEKAGARLALPSRKIYVDEGRESE